MIVTLLSLLGIILITCLKKKIFEEVLSILTALAMGTLISDVALHLIPELLQVESDATSSMKVPSYAWKLVVCIFGKNK